MEMNIIDITRIAHTYDDEQLTDVPTAYIFAASDILEDEARGAARTAAQAHREGDTGAEYQHRTLELLLTARREHIRNIAHNRKRDR